MGEEEGDTHDHLPFSVISFPHLIRWSGVHPRYPATPLGDLNSWRLLSTDIRTKQPEGLVDPAGGYGTYRLHLSHIECKHTNLSLQTPLLLLGPGAALTAASPPTRSLHLAATMCLNPDKLSHHSPLRHVSPGMNTHLTGFNGAVRGATKPNITLCCVFTRLLRFMSVFLPTCSLSDLFSAVIQLRVNGRCEGHLGEDWVSHVVWKLLMSSLWWLEKNISASNTLNWF